MQQETVWTTKAEGTWSLTGNAAKAHYTVSYLPFFSFFFLCLSPFLVSSLLPSFFLSISPPILRK